MTSKTRGLSSVTELIGKGEKTLTGSFPSRTVPADNLKSPPERKQAQVLSREFGTHPIKNDLIKDPLQNEKMKYRIKR